ncbi:MAG: DUF3619 family protein [Burkholderiales bacterium]
MTADDKEIARKITAYLDQSASELRSGTAYRLQQARAAALARLNDPQRATQPRLAGAGANGGTIAGPRPFYAQVRFWIGVALIASAGLGWQQWQVYQQIRENEEIDAQLLTSDLPFDAYLDRGFQVWLKSGAAR